MGPEYGPLGLFEGVLGTLKSLFRVFVVGIQGPVLGFQPRILSLKL